MANYHRSWHGKTFYAGLHYDLHATMQDKELGSRCSKEELIPMLKAIHPDFVQTDCKGHPGIVSWFSQVPDATVAPGIVKDPLMQWREATAALHLPLHCHYSGIWDRAAATKHPEWAVVPAPGKDAKSGKMCPRSAYLHQLMIPQLFELIDRYHVDGFWIDGDLWAVEPCYCDKCTAEFTARTGITVPPVDQKDPNWTTWMNFQRESFLEYVEAYTQAIHQHKQDVLVCSNWLQTFRNPGKPSVSTDWISGDNAWIWGMDFSRCEARWLCNRGKHWDIMLWAFSKTGEMGDVSSPWTLKPAQMLKQEAAMILSTGGNLQIYETTPLRNGQLVPWHMERLGDVLDFVKERRKVCQNTESFPMAAVLHSEEHFYSKITGANIMFDYDASPVSGATWCLSDLHIGVDILDEYALKPKLDMYPLVVVPEQTNLSESMIKSLKHFVVNGGLLLITGTGLIRRFDLSYSGISTMEDKMNATYFVPVDKNESAPLFSAEWGLATPSKSGRTIGKLAETPLLDERLTNFPAAICKYHGDGMILSVPANVFHDYAKNRYPETRRFVKKLLDRLYPDSPITVNAPTAVEFVARTSKDGMFFHFINKASGLPTSPSNGMIDEIPPVGPITLKLCLGWKPSCIELLFEDSEQLSWQWIPAAEQHTHEHDEECHCEHDHKHDEGCCCHQEHGESGVLIVTVQHLALHAVVHVQ